MLSLSQWSRVNASASFNLWAFYADLARVHGSVPRNSHV
jgi:hypothetical protein